jgi:hypothetical protein
MLIDIASDTTFGDEDGFQDFLSTNELAHNNISYLLIGKGFSVENLPLVENPKNNSNWLQDHYTMHQQEFQFLGLNQDNLPDLSVVDFNNQEQYSQWMQDHASVHDFINQVLRITQ